MMNSALPLYGRCRRRSAYWWKRVCFRPVFERGRRFTRGAASACSKVREVPSDGRVDVTFEGDNALGYVVD